MATSLFAPSAAVFFSTRIPDYRTETSYSKPSPKHRNVLHLEGEGTIGHCVYRNGQVFVRWPVQ